MSIHSAAILDKKYIDMLKLLNIYLNHFPRHEKYAICSQIRNTAYDLYNLITEAQKRYYKKTTLTQMDIYHEQLRMQIRFVRKHSIYKFNKALNIGIINTINSLMAHARNTGTHINYCFKILTQKPNIISMLPHYSNRTYKCNI
jgi:hypothetical protein